VGQRRIGGGGQRTKTSTKAKNEDQVEEYFGTTLRSAEDVATQTEETAKKKASRPSRACTTFILFVALVQKRGRKKASWHFCRRNGFCNYFIKQLQMGVQSPLQAGVVLLATLAFCATASNSWGPADIKRVHVGASPPSQYRGTMAEPLHCYAPTGSPQCFRTTWTSASTASAPRKSVRPPLRLRTYGAGGCFQRFKLVVLQLKTQTMQQGLRSPSSTSTSTSTLRGA
jgi:hypothetical protein